MAKAAFNNKTLFTSNLDLNLGKNVVKCYICMVETSDTSKDRSEIPYVVLEKDGEDHLD
jgi:hypothetical protein